MEKDSHYYLKYALALHTCCYDAGESHLIASGDWGQDTNETTVAGFNSGNNGKWHAIGPIEAKRRRLADLEQRVRQESNPRRKLVRLGQLLHFVEDIYPHAGFGEIIGHATPTVTGNDPDSLASDRNKTEGMIRSSINYLLLFCDPPMRSTDRRRRSRQLFNEIRRNGLIDDLINQSVPSWKSGSGTLDDDGDQIIERNKQRIEEFLRDQVAEKVSTIIDFDTQGIPDHLGIEFDDSGEPVSIPRSPNEESDDDDDESQGDQQQSSLIKGDVRIEQVQWDRKSRSRVRVSFTLFNRDAEKSNTGVLTAKVFDISRQAIAAESSSSIPVIRPDNRYKSDILVEVPDSGPCLIELWAHLYDRNASDNQAIVLISSEYCEDDKKSDIDDDCPCESVNRLKLPNRDRERLIHIVTEAKLASRYFQQVISAIDSERDTSSNTVETSLQIGINEIGQTVGEEVGRILAEDIIEHFVRRQTQTPYFSRAPEVGGVERDENGDCYVVVSVFAYSTEAHASEVLERVRVRLGQSDGTVSVASRTDEKPVWNQDSSIGNNGRRRTETYTDVYIPVSESLCDALQAAEEFDLVIEVTVWEKVRRSIGSDKLTPVTHRWSISLTRLVEELRENGCCE